jgi:hypothetical protein
MIVRILGLKYTLNVNFRKLLMCELFSELLEVLSTNFFTLDCMLAKKYIILLFVTL